MKLATVTVTKRPEMWQNVIDNILRQTRRPDYLVIVRHGTFTYPVTETYALLKQNRLQGICVAVPPNWSVGEVTNHAKNSAQIVLTDWSAFEWNPSAGWLCTWDDDDYYGANYLAEIERAANEHPDAWLLGVTEFPVRWIGGKRDGIIERHASGVIGANNSVRGMAGPTICVNAHEWRKHPQMRYPHIGVGCDSEFLQVVGNTFMREYPNEPVPIYHVPNAEFILQRYGDKAHLHDWVWQHDNDTP